MVSLDPGIQSMIRAVFLSIWFVSVVPAVALSDAHGDARVCSHFFRRVGSVLLDHRLPRLSVSELALNPYSIFDGARSVRSPRDAVVLTMNGEDRFLVIDARAAASRVRDYLRERVHVRAGSVDESWIVSIEQRFRDYDKEDFEVLGLAGMWHDTTNLDVIDRLFFMRFFDNRLEYTTEDRPDVYVSPRNAERVAIVSLRPRLLRNPMTPLPQVLETWTEVLPRVSGTGVSRASRVESSQRVLRQWIMPSRRVMLVATQSRDPRPQGGTYSTLPRWFEAVFIRQNMIDKILWVDGAIVDVPLFRQIGPTREQSFVVTLRPRLDAEVSYFEILRVSPCTRDELVRLASAIVARSLERHPGYTPVIGGIRVPDIMPSLQDLSFGHIPSGLERLFSEDPQAEQALRDMPKDSFTSLRTYDRIQVRRPAPRTLHGRIFGFYKSPSGHIYLVAMVH